MHEHDIKYISLFSVSTSTYNSDDYTETSDISAERNSTIRSFRSLSFAGKSFTSKAIVAKSMQAQFAFEMHFTPLGRSLFPFAEQRLNNYTAHTPSTRLVYSTENSAPFFYTHRSRRTRSSVGRSPNGSSRAADGRWLDGVSAGWPAGVRLISGRYDARVNSEIAACVKSSKLLAVDESAE